MGWSSMVLLVHVLSLLFNVGVQSEDTFRSQKNNGADRLLTGAERNATIEMILKDPNVTFFTGENMAGEAVQYDGTNLTSDQVCHNIRDIKSMQASNSCVRVFRGNNCWGKSRALYSQPNTGDFINFLTPELEEVSSVGPCLVNEFQFSNVSLAGSRIAITKNESFWREIPDVVDISGWETYFPISNTIPSLANPIWRYFMVQGKPKWIEARIRGIHLNNNYNWGTTDKRHLAIPPELGGSNNKAYNIFPQTLSNLKRWQQITNQVESHIRADLSNNKAWVYLVFVYGRTGVRKPYGFFYYVNLESLKDDKIMYGFLVN